LNIIIIGSAHPLRGGGISTFNERLAEVLQQEGHNVTIYSFSLQYPSFLFPGKNQFTDEPAPKDLKIRSVINSINPLNWIKTGRQIKKERPDLIIVRYWIPFMGPALGTIIRGAKRNIHTKVISILDNVIPHEKRPGDVPFTRYFLKPIDAFVCMSREVLRDLRKFEPLKPALFSPHPVYDNYGSMLNKAEARENLGIAPQGRYIMFFGFIRKYKGLDILLEAMADERFARENIKLIVAGEYYGDREEYEALIDKLNIRDRLHLFTDFIPNSEVRNYFSAADVVVQPYRTATQSGISQIAYHFEKPMIVTNVGGLPEIVPDDVVGFVTEVDKKAIADAIIRFYDENKEAQFSDNLKEEKKKYSWDYFTQNIIKLYEQVGEKR
jgi:glycosyltransferase involved in cell wall biosynthesis